MVNRAWNASIRETQTRGHAKARQARLSRKQQTQGPVEISHTESGGVTHPQPARTCGSVMEDNKLTQNEEHHLRSPHGGHTSTAFPREARTSSPYFCRWANGWQTPENQRTWQSQGSTSGDPPGVFGSPQVGRVLTMSLQPVRA